MQVSFTAVTAQNTNPNLRDGPMIYVACLAAYNNGKLHGRWIDAIDADDMWDATQAMLADSPEPDAEEWAIHDYQGFGDIQISESMDFDRVAELAEFFNEHGDFGAEVVAHFCGDIDEARTAIENHYAGHHDSLGDFAAEFHEECGSEVPSWLEHYVDWDGMGRDMNLNGDIWTIETGYKSVHVFWNH